MIFFSHEIALLGKFLNICRTTIIVAKIGQNIHVLQIFNKNVLIVVNVGEKFCLLFVKTLTNSQLCLFSKMFANSFRENHKSPRVTFANMFVTAPTKINNVILGRRVKSFRNTIPLHRVVFSPINTGPVGRVARHMRKSASH